MINNRCPPSRWAISRDLRLAPLPHRLLAHMRRWVDRKIITTCFVEWNGKPVKSVKNAFARAVEVAGTTTPLSTCRL